MLSNKIKKLLDSEDLEMVRLGAQLMQAVTPPDQWFRVLDAFSYKDVPYDLWVKKWEFTIEGDVITIQPTIVGLWAMTQKVDMPLINMVSSNNNTVILTDSDKWHWTCPTNEQL